MNVKFYQVTSVPATWEKGAIYAIKPSTVPLGAPTNYCEIYIVDHTGNVVCHTPTWSEIDNNISNKLSQLNGITVVDNIADRDAISNPVGEVYVIDASSDSTVASGGARYLYNSGAWIKTTESESMDLVLDWTKLVNKPNELSKLGEDASGNLTYNGITVKTQWTNTNW